MLIRHVPLFSFVFCPVCRYVALSPWLNPTAAALRSPMLSMSRATLLFFSVDSACSQKRPDTSRRLAPSEA